MTHNTSESSVRIVRIESDDAKRETDGLEILRSLLRVHEPHYPNIQTWIGRKVVPEIRSGARVGYVGFNGEKPILAAVLKKGSATKFCHLSIHPSYQDRSLGHLMFSLMAVEVRSIASEIHFTLPESLWEAQKEFFQTFGFISAAVAQQQYRLFDDELRCTASFSDVWRNILAQLPRLLTSASVAGFRVNDGVVISIREHHAASVMRGDKKVEIRRRFSERWIGRDASVYCAGGSGLLLGTVKVENVIKGGPDDLWVRYGPSLNCSRSEYDAYVAGNSVIYAIELSDPRPYQTPLPLSQLSFLLGRMLRPPQSYTAHTSRDVWGEALSLAAILHGRFHPRPQKAIRSTLDDGVPVLAL